MKTFSLFFLLLIGTTLFAQEKMITDKGIISFEASVPFFEEVKATNEAASCVLLTKTGEISCYVYIKRFNFERSLMQEHFNKNYLESDRYPKASFKGIIEKFDVRNLDLNSQKYEINGKMTIHGKSKKISVNGTLKKTAQGIELISNFQLNTDDYGIQIPYIVRSKIAKKVNTQITCVLR